MMSSNGLITIFFILIVINVKGLRIINLGVPEAVEIGKNATLRCEHDVGNDVLYSLKWYRGRREFFRYTPKELPSVKLFALNGINIDMKRTNFTHLHLRKVSVQSSGKYTCEVSADAPSFQTDIKSLEMIVAVLPTMPPVINGLKRCYTVGEVLHVNCSSEDSLPAATLEWKINNFPVRCRAKLYDLYDQETIEHLEVGKCKNGGLDSPSLSFLSDDDYNISSGSQNSRNDFSLRQYSRRGTGILSSEWIILTVIFLSSLSFQLVVN